MIHGAQNGLQLRAIVVIHALHQRRVPKVKQADAIEAIDIHIGAAERVVGAGKLKECSIRLGRADHHGIGAGLPG